MASRYIALIPAYEPDRRMLGVIADLGKKGFDIVLVDDGSGTEYAELFEEAAERLPGKSGKGAAILIHDTNKGKGAALKTGLDFISGFMVLRGEEKETVIVTVDADGQHLASDAAKAACCAGKHPGTLILGSRRLANADEAYRPEKADKACMTSKADKAGRIDKANTANRPDKTEKAARTGKTAGSGAVYIDEGSQPGSREKQVPWKSRFGNAVTRKVFALAAGTEIYDTQTGLRAFTADLIPELLKISGDRYEYEINMLMELAGMGVPIEEVPIETVYLDGNASSHFSTIRDSYRIYRKILRYMTRGSKLIQAAKFSASSFISFLIDYAVYALLLLIGPGLIFANIGARLVSSAVNFTLNRKVVFKSDKGVLRSAAGYFALAAFILAGNTFVLQTLTGTLGIGAMAAKIMTEVLFFMISWTVQKYVVFYSRPAEAAHEKAVIPDRFLVEYAAVRPKKLKAARRKNDRTVNW